MDFTLKKQSLKKLETELGVHHQELGSPWNRPVTKEMHETAAQYCDNDVCVYLQQYNLPICEG